MIYVTSDWHFCHDKNFIWEPRGFKNVNEMNIAIMKRHNAIVNPEDDVYVLGDCIMNDNEKGIKLIKQLKGKLHIICGNHDTSARIQLYKDCYNIVEVCDAKYLKYNKQMFFLSHHPCITDNHDSDKPLERRIINLAGHTHTDYRWSDFDKGLIYHVDMDAHDCTPILIDNIIKEIKEKVGK